MSLLLDIVDTPGQGGDPGPSPAIGLLLGGGVGPTYVLFQTLHRVTLGMVAQTAAGMNGVLEP